MSVFGRAGCLDARVALEDIALGGVREDRGLLARPEGDHGVVRVVVVNQRRVNRPSRAKGQCQVLSHAELVLEVGVVPLRPGVDDVPATLSISGWDAKQEIGSRIPGREHT